MTRAAEPAGWWAELGARLPGTAVAAGASTPQGRRTWTAGALSQQLVTPSTTFYAGSVTKQLIAVLVARAVLERRVGHHDRVADVVPGLPEWTGPIRVHHLLHHTGALPPPPQLAAALGYPDGAIGWSRLDNAAVLAALHRVAPCSGSPGREFRYDNTGYVLLAEVLRSVSGQGAAALARSVVFDPLGLGHSRLGGAAPMVLPGHPSPPATVGDGGWWTCLSDLLTWLEAMNAERFGADLTALVQSPGQLEDGTVLDYAWGIGPRPGPAGPVYLHGGEWPGWCAMTVRCPTTATAVAILAATDDMPTISSAALELHRHSIATVDPPPAPRPRLSPKMIS